ncbi:MAG: helix-turn-helix transcriptional regulator [Lachnospiraceae bacterium]|nr:helix-turn-helix transcriptional regulator [Lachnospiraceae bacterium]
MTIGEKIRKLRKKNGLTQEKLADYLCVSYQAVSKWECGMSTPDLSLIVPLAKLLHVTTDELLCVNDEETDNRYNELKQAYEHTFKTEDFAERQKICELAVSEYPGDMKWLLELAWVVSNRSFEYKDNDRYIAEQEKAIKLFDAVIKNCKDDAIRGSAIQGITQLLGWRGRKDEARKYVEMIPERAMITRDAVMENILESDELLLFKQKRIKRHIEGVLWDLSLMPTLYTDLMRDIVSVVIPDGNYMEFNHSLYYAVKRKINHVLKHEPDAPISKISDLLHEMKSYAKAYDKIAFTNPGVYKYTVSWFDHIEEDTREWLGSEGKTMMQDFIEYLDDPQFDPMRSRELFCLLKE